MIKKLLYYLGLFLFSTLIAILLIQIIFRFFLNLSVPWTEEMSRIIFIHFCFLGTAIAIMEKEMIVIDTILSRINGKARQLIEVLITVFTFIFILILFIGSLKMMISVWPTRFSTMDKVSTGWLYAGPVYSSLIILLNELFAITKKVFSTRKTRLN